jgi:hypothetical protein
MLRKVIIVFTSIIVLSGIIYCLTFFLEPFALDEKEILKETREAFKNVKFEEEPFIKKEKIRDFSKFLLRHIEEIKNYNRHEEFRKIQLTAGSWTSHYTNSGDCFNMPTFHDSFVKEYIPPELIDSLLYYSEGLRDDFLSGFSVCNENYDKNLNATKGSLSFILNYKEKDLGSGNYYLYHEIIQNRKFKSINTIISIYENGLAKDTLMLNDLKYTITLIPYSGM